MALASDGYFGLLNAAGLGSTVTSTTANITGTGLAAYVNYANLNAQANQYAIFRPPVEWGPNTFEKPKGTKSSCCGRSEGETHAPDCWRLTDQCSCHAGRASEHHSLLWRLRKEISDWHGDILERGRVYA